MTFDDRPILSICVPTYNRSARLRECLTSIMRSAAATGNCVEILVSDNASTDDTSSIVRGLQAMDTRIRYHRNPENVGAEMNFRVCAEQARGRYVWLIGDDDAVDLGAIGSILDRLRDDVSVVICNFSLWSNDFAFLKRHRYYRFSKDMRLHNPDEVLRYFGISLAYISSVVVKRALYVGVDRSAYGSFADFGFSFLYSVYAALLKECHVVYLAQPLVRNRMAYSVSYDWFRVFVTGASVVLNALVREGYTSQVAAKAQDRVLSEYIIGNIFYHGMRYQNSIGKTIRLLWPHYKTNWLFWLVCLPALLVPRSLVELARTTVRAARGRRW